jgi:hypothetical protein
LEGGLGKEGGGRVGDGEWRENVKWSGAKWKEIGVGEA